MSTPKEQFDLCGGNAKELDNLVNSIVSSGSSKFLKYAFTSKRFEKVPKKVFRMILDRDEKSRKYFIENAPAEMLPNVKDILTNINKDLTNFLGKNKISYPYSEAQYNILRPLLFRVYELENAKICEDVDMWNVYHIDILNDMIIQNLFEFLHKLVPDINELSAILAYHQSLLLSYGLDENYYAATMMSVGLSIYVQD